MILNDMICDVIVVPMFAPSIIDMDCGRLISPALTNPIAITVVALLLCSTAVVKAPARTPITGFLVSSSRMLFIFSPAAFCRHSLIMFMPKINTARPPSKPNRICNVSFIICSSFLFSYVLIVFYYTQVKSMLSKCKVHVKFIHVIFPQYFPRSYP